jgi:hypothetical protein
MEAVVDLSEIGASVVLLLREHNENIIARLQGDGIEVIEGKTLQITLPVRDKSGQFDIPDYINGGIVTVVGPESGSRFKNIEGGSAITTAGLTGKMKRPFSTNSHRKNNGTQAMFSSVKGLTLAHSEWGREHHIITLNQIKIESVRRKTVTVCGKEIYRGIWEAGEENYGIELNNWLHVFYPVATAAITKSLSLDNKIYYANIRPKPRS